MEYLSDRTRGPVPRTSETMTEAAWGGAVAHLRRRIENGALGHAFPEMCPDGNGPFGTDEVSLRLSACAEIPENDWPPTSGSLPSNEVAFDLVEFVHRHVAEPEERDWHSFMRHHHLRFGRDAGRASWRADVNRVLQRSGIAYELQSDGRVVRVLPEAIGAPIAASAFDTGDPTLDGLLHEATRRFVDRDAPARRDAVEKLWDAFERTKTLLDPDKKAGATRILEESSSTSDFRRLLDVEARTLTEVGNNFRIRHSEHDKVELTGQELDYVFGRLFVLL